MPQEIEYQDVPSTRCFPGEARAMVEQLREEGPQGMGYLY